MWEKGHYSHGGVVVHVNSSGIGVLQKSSSDVHFAFTFDKICGYRGQTPTEIGLHEGQKVTFYIDDKTNAVTAVDLLSK